ncbi:MAG: hypothetical protein U9Q66_00020 [Patescibacteria group bacterium]|nr:hypothetical protein [Patescibacteria group bacterium]
MDQVKVLIVVEVVMVKTQDQVDEFQLGLSEVKLLYSEECQN